MKTFKEKDRVITKLGETGTIKGKVFTGQYLVEIDNSEDKQKFKRWFGNIIELYSPNELSLTEDQHENI